ncbi:hypothetical protein Tco_0247105 [Tanacetum coccineum]
MKGEVRWPKHLNGKFASAIYSVSVDDLDTTHCFFDCKDMRLGPRKMQKPVMDLLVSEQFAFKGSIVCLRDFLVGGGGGGVGMLLFVVEVEEDGGYVGDDVETGVVGIIVDAELGITGSVSLTVMFGDGD